MNAQQAAHWRMLAAKHQDTPGDLATAYRVIGELLQENEQLQQTIQDYTALSDAVEELARIEKAYTRLPDNTWPEWDGAYDAMYAINQELRQS